jgi:hypothetical protein
MSEQPQQETQPEPAAGVGDVVYFEVANPYGDEGATVDTHAGLVAAVADGRLRVVDLGDVARLADFPADAVRSSL